MNKLRVALIQEDLIWENSHANLRKFEKYLQDLDNVDLVVLPEMFNTGFSMNPDSIAQANEGAVVKWMKNMAMEHNTSIMGSVAIKDAGKYYNRFFMSYPCSDVKWYDKRHLFRMGGENEVYSPGTKRVVFKYFGWRFKPQICYDLRFPLWSRNNNDYDLLIYVANWPEPRAEVWKTLLKARAIENQSYVIGVNRIGEDGRGIKYAGDSMIIDPKGKVIETIANKPGIIQANLELSELKIFREKFPVHLDADDFSFKL